MRRFTIVVLTVLLVVTMAPAVAADRGPAVRLIVVTDQAGPPTPAAFAAAGATGFEALEFVPNTVVVTVPESRQDAIAGMDGVVAVGRDFVVQAVHHECGHDRPVPYEGDCDDDGDNDNGDNDGGDSTQTVPWGVAKIGAPAAWDAATGTDTRVCIADTGIEKNHEDLKVVAGRNFTRGGANAWDDKNGHGTHVAGTVAALDNNLGVVGVAHDTGLLAAKVLDNSGSGQWSWILNGLGWCDQQGADVINMSFGATGDHADISNLLDDLTKDIVLVAASGNSSSLSEPLFPARHEGVIAVGATDKDDEIASWSTRGEDVNAPGVSILSTEPGSSYGTKSGTSMASPHTAGTAALLRQCDPDLSTGDVRDTLIETAAITTSDELRVDAAAAVTSVCPS